MKLAHFLLSPTLLSQTSDPIDTGGGMTRRLFIKRTGGATVATLVAWNLSTQRARAEVSESQSQWSTYNPLVLVCTGYPSSSVQNGQGTNRVTDLDPFGLPRIDPYQTILIQNNFGSW